MNRQPLWIAVLAAALAVSASPPAAQAAATSVSAGDRIHVGTAICSLAYAYRSTTNGHTYAITAAHCQQPGSTTARTDTGATGTFTRAALDPAGSGGTDFALLGAQTEHGAEAWNARLRDPSTHVLVHERPDGSIAACAFVRICEETAYFGGLYVEDAGRGLGRMLRDERLRIARESGARIALMMVRQANEPARVHAEKAGFSVVGEDPCTFLSTVPRLVYAMALDAPVLLPV